MDGGRIKIRGSGRGLRSHPPCVFGCASGPAAGHKPRVMFYYSIIILATVVIVFVKVLARGSRSVSIAGRILRATSPPDGF